MSSFALSIRPLGWHNFVFADEPPDFFAAFVAGYILLMFVVEIGAKEKKTMNMNNFSQ